MYITIPLIIMIQFLYNAFQCLRLSQNACSLLGNKFCLFWFIAFQILWLSQHQNQLCTDLESLSGRATLDNRTITPPSTHIWALSHPYFYRSMPEQINTNFTPTPGEISSPPSVRSAPFCPTGAYPNLPSSSLLKTAPPVPKRRAAKLQPSFSESSFDESIDFGAPEGAGTCWLDVFNLLTDATHLSPTYSYVAFI